MSALAGLPVLTAAETRNAEHAAIAAGRSVAELMEAAGAGVARWAARLAGGAPILVLCGPGNNGGDGYVAARRLRAEGAAVTVAALAEPATAAAGAAAAAWAGGVTTLEGAGSAPVVVDALFGTGMNRPLVGPAATRIVAQARLAIAVDLPSGLDADSGLPRGEVGRCDVTLALGALKPAHLLQPGTALCGAVRLVDLGLDVPGGVRVLPRPCLLPPDATAHKYSRGMVAIVAGAMPGAAMLAATAALRAGAGYVAIYGGEGRDGPAALVHRPLSAAALAERRIGCVLVGPGLGRDQAARDRLAVALGAGKRLVLDGDALRLIDPAAVPAGSVLTPHAGEFDALFGAGAGSKIGRTRAAAERCGCVVVHKGPDTIVAEPGGRIAVAEPGSSWLASAGTGDVLAGTIAARLAECGDAFASACAGVWMHARAARMIGGGLIADDLPDAIGRVRAGS